MYIMYIREKMWRNRLDSLLMDLWDWYWWTRESNRQEVDPPSAQIYSIKGFSALIYEHFIFSIIPIIKNPIVSAIIKLNVWDQKNFNVPSGEYLWFDLMSAFTDSCCFTFN